MVGRKERVWLPFLYLNLSQEDIRKLLVKKRGGKEVRFLFAKGEGRSHGWYF